MFHASSEARVARGIRSVRLHSLLDDVARVVVVHAPADSEVALTVAAEMRSAGHDTGLFEITRAVVDDVATDDPDLVLVVRTSDSFSLPDLCSELHDALKCRTIVLDFGTNPSGLLSPPEEGRLVEALEAGADDYLSGIGRLPVLHARVRVALRARPARRRQPRQIEIGDVVIDVQAHELVIAGVSVSCRPLQFNILIALATRVNEVVTREALIAGAWGLAPESIDTSRVRIAISVLRRILGDGPQRPKVESIARLGYRLSVPMSS